MNYIISPKAYSKIILHAHKYPFSPVNGIILGRLSSKDTVNIEDVIPLFHTHTLAPIFEIAMMQIEEYCNKSEDKLIIVGHYHANEILDDARLGMMTRRIAEKLQGEFTDACLIMVDNTKLSLHPKESALQLYTRKNGSNWEQSPSLRFSNASTLRLTEEDLQNEKWNKFVDFDLHLDNPSKSWLNAHLDL
eukprot:TRINITY_DN8281_c0_g1_i1.p1 TRINITY_DN8281_c0_g1~~TRINITY_DN8281_c0_g1_i1.p1  ORF type:complete len:202 (-),score=31.00 TRINITY_DN8281_c0_g1_i1:91-663(-)